MHEIDAVNLSNLLPEKRKKKHVRQTTAISIAIELFTELGNGKQALSKSAYEFVIRFISLRQKI